MDTSHINILKFSTLPRYYLFFHSNNFYLLCISKYFHPYQGWIYNKLYSRTSQGKQNCLS